jgi:hypothetical protein
MNELESSKLWCPMIRIEVQRTNGCSAVSDPRHQRANCIGSQCAMWRWFDKPSQIFHVTVMCEDSWAEVEPERPDDLNEEFVFIPCDEDTNAHWSEPEKAWMSRRRGYCGLAGRPEVMP